MKRIYAYALICMFTAGFAGAQGFINFTPNIGYMYQHITTTYNYSSLGEDIKSELNAIFEDAHFSVSLQSKQEYSALAVGLDIQAAGLWYLSATVGLPRKLATAGFDPSSALYDRTLSTHTASNIKAFIVDSQVGLGIPLHFRKLNLFGGIAASVNYIDVKRTVDKRLKLSRVTLTELTDFTKTATLGAGTMIRVN